MNIEIKIEGQEEKKYIEDGIVVMERISNRNRFPAFVVDTFEVMMITPNVGLVSLGFNDDLYIGQIDDSDEYKIISEADIEINVTNLR